MNSAILGNTRRNLAALLITPAFVLLAACGSSSSGGGGGGGGGETAPGVSVALFANNTYVDYQAVPTGTNEANNEQSLLSAQGHSVTPFTGITAAAISAAVAGRQALVIPKLELGDLDAALDAAARTAIATFVNNGGTLIVHLSNTTPAARAAGLLNASFGYGLTTVNDTGAITRSGAGVVGTPYADCGPASLTSLIDTFALTSASLPAGARIIYQDAAGNAVVTLIPAGGGFIVVIGWDLFSSKPVGVADSGWWSVMHRAVRLRDASSPNVAYVHGGFSAGVPADVVAKLQATCQFESVAAINAGAVTPTLPALQAFDAILVASDAGFADSSALGNTVADYVDTGRGVVLGVFSYHNAASGAPSLGVLGRFETANYYCIPSGSGQIQGIQETGVFLPSAADHPLLAGVTNFDGGTQSYQPNASSVVAGTTVLANWSDGTTPLVAHRTIGSARRVDLGFWPASSDGAAGSWVPTTDGDKLLANALSWGANLPPSRTFSNATATPIPDVSTINSTLAVSGATTSITKVRVELNITHTFDADLDIFLEAPDGTMIELTTDNGGSGNNFVSTVFDDSAPTSIVGSLAPLTGSFRPEAPLAGLIGKSANGNWILHVTDDASADTGTLNSWRLFIR